jgi:hypothetical protein
MYFSVFNISFAKLQKSLRSYNLNYKHQTAKTKCNHNDNEITGNNPNLVPKQVNDISALRIKSLDLLCEGEIPTSDDGVD